MKRHIKGLVWAMVLAMMLPAACIKDIEKEGIYTTTDLKGRVVESASQRAVRGLTVRLVCGEATLGTTATDEGGTFALAITAERQAEGCRVVVSADSLYVGCTAEVPDHGFGRRELDLGVLQVEGPRVPEVHTCEVRPDDVSATAATLGGEVADDQRSAITGRGFAYSILQYPTLADGSVAVGGTLGEYTATVDGLRPGTTYYVRAYATNGVGTAYGEQQSFTTPSGLPVVRTAQEITLTGNSAQCGGTVVEDGGFAVTARGVCWSMAPEPTLSNLHSTDGSGLGTFVSTIGGLQPGTTYYVRAYATNACGTAYGEQHSVSTVSTASGLPTVVTVAATGVTATAAQCGGEVTGDGGYMVVQRGVCYSTTLNPTTASPHTTDGTGAGTFVSNLVGLTPGTTYHYRAYATNANGTVYGTELQLTTEP